ncbi:hypothetical protein TEA_021795 [Camellia sinensis var. sinensis]|uniref:Disease resistance R13L4/SHOC-2-like LRR domain-containing protein n=1 Tax=Camellia sinensis var. sinensis TaxID=542762 RepID=A0A4S4DVT6_CAMSN|nr:hypothetical protein TEA_021795 [Camellia sinensis var. sinensis]
MVAGNRDTIDQEFVSPPLKEDSMLSYIPHFIAHSHEKPSPWPLTEYMSGSQSLKLTKSRSCKASLMTSPSYSPWLSRKGSQSSIRSKVLKSGCGRRNGGGDTVAVAGCKGRSVTVAEKAEFQQEKQVADNPLRIWDNLALTGYFPEFLNSSSPLQYLSLTFTNFSGELPDSIGNLKSLKRLYAACCKFYGSIPTSLGNLTEMTHLAIEYNIFTGMFPSSLSNLGNLVYLGVTYNNFEGKIADFLPNAKSLLYLYVNSNSFSGPFPSLGANLTKLAELDLSSNQVRGPLPSQIIGLPNLARLSLGDNLINGTIPSWVFSLPALGYFNLSNNKLTGHVKEFKSTHLTDVDLSNNNLHGSCDAFQSDIGGATFGVMANCGQANVLCNAGKLKIRFQRRGPGYRLIANIANKLQEIVDRSI